MKTDKTGLKPAGSRRTICSWGLRTALLLGVTMLALACYEDKGNYTYTKLDEVVIDTAGMGLLPSYAILRSETLTIGPKVYFNGASVDETSDVPLDFVWTIYQETTGGVKHSRDTLARSVGLSATIMQPTGQWTALLSVTHRRTKVQSFMKFSVKIDESISDGWLVLYERNGNTDAGLIVNDRVKTGVTTERVFIDLYSKTNGQPLGGQPRNITHTKTSMAGAGGEILIASEYDALGVDRNYFMTVFPFNDLFWSPPKVKRVGYISGNNNMSVSKETLINDNKVHIFNMASGTTRLMKFNDPCAGTYGELAPWAATCYSAAFNAIVYDQTNTCFRYVANNGVEVMPFVLQPETAPFNLNNTGMQMLYSDWGYGNGVNLTNEYSVMKGGGNYALLQTDFDSGTSTTTATTFAKGKYGMNDCPAIAGINSISAGTVGRLLFYGSGNSVYLFKYLTGAPAEKVWQAPAGEEVTCVRVQKHFYYIFTSAGILPNSNKVIYVATWNEAAQTGTVRQMLMDAVSGEINAASERAYPGFGKVRDMAYKYQMGG